MDELSTLPNKSCFPIAEAARLLGVSRMTIYRWILKGDVESIGMYYKLKVSRDSLLRKVSV